MRHGDKKKKKDRESNSTLRVLGFLQKEAPSEEELEDKEEGAGPNLKKKGTKAFMRGFRRGGK